MPGERSEADCASQGSSGGAGIGSSSRGVVGRAWESGGSADGGSPHDRASISSSSVPPTIPAPRKGRKESEKRCRVMVSSTGSWSELAAVEKVFRRCVVEAFRGSSGVREQTLSHEEALQGAANRLQAAKETCPNADYYVAIERSLTKAHVPPGVASSSLPVPADAEAPGAHYFDVSWVVLERNAPDQRQRTAVPCCGVELPLADVECALGRQDRGAAPKTAAQVTAERVGFSDGRDPHTWLTGGRRSREVLLSEAVSVALGQLERIKHSETPDAAPTAKHPPAKHAEPDQHLGSHGRKSLWPMRAKPGAGGSDAA